jgi:RNA polymerase sigma-70 factor (ECF subfamily)
MCMNTLADEEVLLAAARAGDVACFNALVARHEDAAYDLAYRLLRDDLSALRATEEAFLAAYRALPAFRGGPFRVWLLGAVARACRRQRERRPRRPGAPPGRPPADGTVAVHDDPCRRVEAGIAGLPWEQRLVLVLSDVAGLRYGEVARVTGASPAAVRLRLGSARAQLRDWLHRVAGDGLQ